MSASQIERKLKWAAGLVGLGLLVQLVTFSWVHALAFTAFLVVGCPLVAAGIIVYLLSLLSYPPPGNHSSSS
jgi:hypothetical protein